MRVRNARTVSEGLMGMRFMTDWMVGPATSVASKFAVAWREVGRKGTVVRAASRLEKRACVAPVLWVFRRARAAFRMIIAVR